MVHVDEYRALCRALDERVSPTVRERVAHAIHPHWLEPGDAWERWLSWTDADHMPSVRGAVSEARAAQPQPEDPDRARRSHVISSIIGAGAPDT